MYAQDLRATVASATENDKRRLVLGVGALMIGAQLAFRAWALYPSWFYADDYELMIRARMHVRPDVDYLLSPVDSHLMPLGKLLIWLVSHSGTTNWALAATITLAVQLAASCACLWMFRTMFGERWANLALLALYLTSAIAMPALMWWAAFLNQLPVQLAFFGAMSTWITYLRGRRVRWCVLTALFLVVGLASDVRAMLTVPVLLFVMILYFGAGRPLERLVTIWRDYWPALGIGALVTTAYTVYYVAAIPPPFETGPAQGSGVVTRALGFADSMLGVALTSGAAGGPWEWFKTTPPIVLAGPPAWTVRLSWILISFTVAVSVLRRTRVMRGWALTLGYALALFVLLSASRGQIYGGLAGLEYRYLTEMSFVIPLGLGLVFMELRGAPGSSSLRAHPVLSRGPNRLWVCVVVFGVCAGSIVTSVKYVHFWHYDNAGKNYVQNLQESSAAAPGRVNLPNQAVPPGVMPELHRTRPIRPRCSCHLLRRKQGFRTAPISSAWWLPTAS